MHSEQTLLGRLFVLYIAVIAAVKLRMMVNAIPGKERKWWNWKEFLRHAATYASVHFPASTRMCIQLLPKDRGCSRHKLDVEG